MGRLVRLATLIVVLFSPTAGIAQEIDLVKIRPVIIGAAEELRRAWMRRDLILKEYQSIMEISCDAFLELSHDSSFENLVREYEKSQYDANIASEVRNIFLNFRSFLEFLMIEQDLLRDSGLSEAAVDALLGQMMTVRLEAAGFKLDSEALLADVGRLAEQACSVSESVSESVKKSEMWCNIERFGTFATGAVATIADGVALFATKIPQAAVTASGMLGAVVIAGAAMMPQC
jgi:hypothetical protein